METHLKFTPGQQEAFILDVIRKSNLNINKLAKIVGISPRNFRDWKNEKVSISKKAALILSDKFGVGIPEKTKILESRWKLNKAKAGRVGGNAYKKKYGNPGTYEGRKKGGSKTLEILRTKGIIPQITTFHKPNLSPKLAEFMGIMLGDGGIGKLQISITLNSVKDLDYSHYVIRLCKSLFGNKPKTRKRRNANALEIYYNGINLIKILMNLGLVPGNKVKNQVGVPNWIKANSKYRILCLRGLMDTDGGIFIHKYMVRGKLYYYKKISFSNRSLPLLKFVYNTLIELNFHPKLLNKIENKQVWLYNSHEIQQYLKIVGSSNYRLYKYQEGGVA